MKKLFGLGKGLGSLIPASTREVANDTKKESVFYIEVAKIRPNAQQPRKDFDQDAIAELSKSIRKYGVLQPILVSKVEDPNPRGMDVYYELIAGERRWRAAKLAGLPHVPAIIKDDLDDGKSRRLEVALIENIQRENLNSMEEAEAYDQLQTKFGLTQAEIAAKVSKSREAVTNTIRLLKLPNYIKDALRSSQITMAHARALLSLTDESKQKQVYNQILAGGFSSKDVEAVAANAKADKASRRDTRYVELEKNLGQKLAVPVLIKTGIKGGQIVIRFTTAEQLNVIAKSIID